MDLASGLVKKLPLQHQFSRTSYYAYVKRGRAMSPATIAFRDRLVQLAKTRQPAG
ncbi:hypothetical protein [Hydrogenophaga sp. OTU3427]|uniref:hypothetical protein n=1 Tax=Hydrogenophaga sp. OTU3427 TaxID=3043856 RepID=UPI00313BFA01